MAWNHRNYRISGVSPLIMHNGQLADPLNKWAQAMKKVSSKRAKTEADHAEMARLEWMGSLYLSNREPCIPSECIEGTLLKSLAAKKLKTAGKAGLFVNAPSPLIYEGPRDPDSMWEDERFRLVVGVKVGQSRVMRTRPIYQEWAAECSINYNDEILNASDLDDAMVRAGETVGLMDWRPKFGRFSVVIL